MADRLIGQTSPYLLQHRNNPVDWWPWGPEAMAEAWASKRPIMLSVGYAACHWCHVMAHESFEDPAVARIINELFVPIKVDREERPDLDVIYQHALAALQQSGGWPLTMFLTPVGQPFWGGTYFPPEARWGHPGFTEVLYAVADVWANQKDTVQANVAGLTEVLNRLAAVPGGMGLTLPLLDQCAHAVLPNIDRDHGGTKGAPKFPQPGLFDFLWRAALRTGDDALKTAVTGTLDHLCDGGIYDHLGGGFMRYSTDERWLVPHFEKMLYDNAQLVELLTLAWQGTGSPLYRQRIDETIGWMLREMIAEDGGFAATLDADSEGGEGHFYTWDHNDILRLLGNDTALFARAYDVTAEGNWEDRTILNRRDTTVDDALLAPMRAILLNARAARPRPGRDDKMLADWNGMAIAALAHAALAFQRPDWLAAARAAFDAVRTTMSMDDNRLAHARNLGRSGTVGLLDDLAHMARAALALYEATAEADYLDYARHWVDAADRHHWDEAGGGYFQAANDAEDIIVRLKPVHDTAVPSANGVMAEVLARLGQLASDARYTARAEALIATFSAAVPQDFPHMTALLAGFEQLTHPVEITIAGTPDSAAHLLRAVATTAIPTRVIHWGPPATPPTAIICRATTCGLPLENPEDVRASLAKGQ
jgi:uncharacterized protein